VRFDLDTEFFDSPCPRAIAHRGASGDFPENTMPAFRAAADSGAPYIELDVHLTRDGEIVVIHDDDLTRIAGHHGALAEMTAGEIFAVDAGRNFSPPEGGFPFRGRGIRLPTLAQVLSEFRRMMFIIEIKEIAPAIAAPLLKVIDRAGMRRRVLIASEHQPPIDEVRRLVPSIPTNFARGDVADFLMALPPGAPPCRPRGDALQIPPEHDGWKFLTPEIIAAAHRIGVEVHFWTIDDESEMRAALALGADGILTNYPARLLKVIADGAARP
jgi:glycerophosphoryl diester phosphodiesterase